MVVSPCCSKIKCKPRHTAWKYTICSIRRQMFPLYLTTRPLALIIHSFHTSSIIPRIRSSVLYLTHPIRLHIHLSHISLHFHTHDPFPPLRCMILYTTTQNHFSLYNHHSSPSSHSLHYTTPHSPTTFPIVSGIFHLLYSTIYINVFAAFLPSLVCHTS